MRKTLLLALALCCLTFGARASGISGQRYDTFLRFYEENLTFINQNDGRHLLPLSIAKRNSGDGDGRLVYEIFGDVLSLTIRTDPSGEVIELCQIVMTAPQGMEVGGVLHNDFEISGYHSYALLMAMDSATEPAQRYQLVTDVVGGMAENNGVYTAQLGMYKLHCARIDNTAVLSFDNNLVATPEPPPIPLAPDATISPDEQPDTDAGAGLG